MKSILKQRGIKMTKVKLNLYGPKMFNFLISVMYDMDSKEKYLKIDTEFENGLVIYIKDTKKYTKDNVKFALAEHIKTMVNRAKDNFSIDNFNAIPDFSVGTPFYYSVSYCYSVYEALLGKGFTEKETTFSKWYLTLFKDFTSYFKEKVFLLLENNHLVVKFADDVLHIAYSRRKLCYLLDTTILDFGKIKVIDSKTIKLKHIGIIKLTENTFEKLCDDDAFYSFVCHIDSFLDKCYKIAKKGK